MYVADMARSQFSSLVPWIEYKKNNKTTSLFVVPALNFQS